MYLHIYVHISQVEFPYFEVSLHLYIYKVGGIAASTALNTFIHIF